MRCRRQRLLLVGVLIAIAFLVLTLPYDNQIRLAYRFHFVTKGPDKSDPWLRQRPIHDINWDGDVGVILKTGHGTRHRIVDSLNAIQQNTSNNDNVVIIADFDSPSESTIYRDDQELVIHNAAGQTVEKVKEIKKLNQLHEMQYLRIQKYNLVSEAIVHNHTSEADRLNRGYGWDLDAMKFITGLEIAYQQMPDKKWYLLVDDDTCIVKPTMELLLRHIDPTVPRYIGNPVGSYKGRFAHGGSSIILSRPLIQQLIANRRVMQQAYLDSLAYAMGDNLLAMTFMKVGIYLDEQYALFFNGEDPITTKIRGDRFCAPLMGFHELKQPGRMHNVSKVLRDMEHPISWLDVWSLYGGRPLDTYGENTVRMHWDHVGRRDEYTRSLKNVRTPETCIRACRSWQKCIAWTWQPDKTCHLSPWMTIGKQAKEKATGLMAPRVKHLATSCAA